MRIFFLLAFNLTILFYIAQKGQIVGKVVDKPSNAPISYVTVSLLNFGDSTLLKGVISDEKGEFRIENIVLNQSYLLRFSFIGYQTLFKALDFRKNKLINLKEVVIVPSAELLKGLEVRTDQPMVTFEIDKKVIIGILSPNQYKIAALSKDTLGQLSAFRLGQIYIQLNQFNAAINAFQTVLETEFNPNLKPQSYFFMAKSWFQLGNFEEAIDKLDFFFNIFY